MPFGILKLNKNAFSQAQLPLRKKAILAICGIILSLFFLEIGLQLFEFVFLSLQEYGKRAAVYKKGAYRIMCLGESTAAIGGRDSYSSQLEEISAIAPAKAIGPWQRILQVLY